MSDSNGNLSKPLLIVLAVSLAFNLFLGGLWIGAKMGGHKKRDYKGDHLEFNMRGLRAAIQGEKAMEFRRILREQREDVRTRMAAQALIYKQLSEALTAEELDIDLVSELLAEQRAHSGEFRKPMHVALLAVLPTMTVEERTKLVEALREKRPRYRKKHRDGDGDYRRRPPGDRDAPPPPPEGKNP